MKKYLKSLFPWRWTIVITFILLYSVIIWHVFAYSTLTSITAMHPWKVYVGNFFFWIFIDWAFGLGKHGDLFKPHNRID